MTDPNLAIRSGTKQAGERLPNGDVATRIVVADSSALDAFGRLRMAQPFTIFDSKFLYGDVEDQWLTELSGVDAAAIYLPNENSIQMTLGQGNGDFIIRQSRQYMQYIPGKSQALTQTGVLGAAKIGVTQTAGLYDDENGPFFEQTSDGLFVVLRSKASGLVVDTKVHQSNPTLSTDGISTWNLDKLDGSKKPFNPSGIDIDFSKAQIFFIDYQWLGVGRVRMGFSIAGRVHYCHEFLNANVATGVFMTTPNLPVRYELRNTAAVTTNTVMKQICSAVTSEGGYEPTGFGYSVHTANTGRAISTGNSVPIISIRLKNSFNGKDNRITGLFQRFNISTQTNDILYRLVHTADIDTNLTGASWESVSADSGVEYDISATALAGGHNIDSGFVATGQGSFSGTFTAANLREIGAKHLAFTQNFDSSESQGISLVALTITGNATVRASLSHREVY